MLSKAKIKFLQSLQQKKFRQLYHRFLVDGDKTVRELFASTYKVESIYAEPWWLNKYSSLINKETEVNEIDEATLYKVSSLQTPNGVIAVVQIPDNNQLHTSNHGLILALDNINDPGNLGTIIRIAEWFGIGHVLCSMNCVDVYNPKTVNAAKGSLFRTNVHYTDLSQYFNTSQQNVYGAVLDGNNIYQTDFKTPGVILIGSEAHGISKELMPFVTHPITIPAYGAAESLNAGVATGIICAEVRRKLG